jgi:hypothetical protein
MIQEIQVRRDRIDEARLVAREPEPLRDGEVRVAVRDFALTANNVSYAASGEMIGYWRFFPAADDGETWGVVPVWGYGEIIESRHPEFAAGEGFWGFLPMSEEVIFAPSGRKSSSFIDAAAHRQDLPALYNQYLFTGVDRDPLQALADERSLLLPLFFTSYVLADYLQDNGFFGARQAVLSSASSKTAFGLAKLLADLPGKPVEVVGLTSPDNIGFTKALGYYDRVLGYGEIASLDPARPAVFVDMAGSAKTLNAIHHLFEDALKASIRVGATHWEEFGGSDHLPGPRPAFFFAPAQVAKREQDWGPGEVQRRAQAAFVDMAQAARAHLRIERRTGAEAVAETYLALARNEVSPKTGLILGFDA